jgi:hypothetical protein
MHLTQSAYSDIIARKINIILRKSILTYIIKHFKITGVK